MNDNRTQYELLHQWLKDHPKESTSIALSAIWGLYGERGKIPDDPEEREFPSGADYQSFVDQTISACGLLEPLRALRKSGKRKAFPEVTHWIVSGRIPYDDEDSTFHVAVPRGSSPAHEFTVAMYEGSDQELPENYADLEAPHGAWTYINAEIEIHGPPV